MSKPPIGQKRCAFKGCKETFEAVGRRAYCDKHRPGGMVAKVALASNVILVSERRAMVGRLIEAAEGLGLAKAQSIVDEVTADILRRSMAMRKDLIKSRHEVQKLKDQLAERKLAKEFDDPQGGIG
jgi:hypothetical protein